MDLGEPDVGHVRGRSLGAGDRRGGQVGSQRAAARRALSGGAGGLPGAEADVEDMVVRLDVGGLVQAPVVAAELGVVVEGPHGMRG
ncbi:hypothetical protein SAMN05421854_1208 [Amycolatopsis rubida]|uniref:Uncharacterized protein n=1 Tax=Amycolatopsis rubida TaxID=112413 RepID=A0A1I6AN57_9PSEU|nr:hypothetical protein SAMN05421854_1208 [Amycolatopsis rubida]